MSEKLSKEEQLMAGIDFLVLGRKYIIQDRKKKQADLLYLLDELHNFDPFGPDTIDDEDNSPILQFSKTSKNKNRLVTSKSEKLRKKYDPYSKAVERKFGVEVDFQSKFIAYSQDKTNKLHKMCKFYLGTYCTSFNDDSLTRLINSRKETEQEDLLYLLVLLKYSVQWHLPIDFKYRKIMHQTVRSRKVIPYEVTTRNGYISLIGQDIQDRKTKSFILNCIVSVQTDLENSFKSYGLGMDSNNNNFDLDHYEASDPSARFQRRPVQYKLKLFANTYGHFKETFNIKHSVASTSQKETIVEFTSVDPYLIFQIVFNYGEYCLLVSPVEEVNRFKAKLKSLSKFYK